MTAKPVGMEAAVRRIETLLAEQEHVFVAIDGPCASGKTTLARNLNERFETETLAPLANGKTALYRPWDCHAGDFMAARTVNPARLTIVEGSYGMHPALRRYYDCMICLAIAPAEQLRRLEARNPRMLQRFIDEWIPLENRYFEATGIQAAADMVVDTALPNNE